MGFQCKLDKSTNHKLDESLFLCLFISLSQFHYNKPFPLMYTEENSSLNSINLYLSFRIQLLPQTHTRHLKSSRFIREMFHAVARPTLQVHSGSLCLFFCCFWVSTIWSRLPQAKISDGRSRLRAVFHGCRAVLTNMSPHEPWSLQTEPVIWFKRERSLYQKNSHSRNYCFRSRP